MTRLGRFGVLFLFAGCAAASQAPRPSASSTPNSSSKPATTTVAASAQATASTQPSAPLATSSSAPAAAPPPGPPPALPKDTVVLHVGDSMADALGKSLKRELEKRGIKNILKAQESTYIPGWAGHKHNFRGLLATYNPDLVIITLGGNEVAMPDPSIRAEPIKRMVEAVAGRPCLWIAAPLWPGGPHTGILDVVRANCKPCRYVDTNVLIPDLERLGDKVHPTIPERRRWAKYMIRWLRHNRDPNGARPWDFKSKLEAPPPSW